MNKKDSTRDFWFRHYQAFNKTGLSQREYCRNNNLGYWTFSKWKRSFEKSGKSLSLQQLPLLFAPVKAERFEIRISNSMTLIVPEEFSDNALRRILTALGAQ